MKHGGFFLFLEVPLIEKPPQKRWLSFSMQFHRFCYACIGWCGVFSTACLLAALFAVSFFAIFVYNLKNKIKKND